MGKKLIFSSDSVGFDLKEELKEYVTSLGYEVEDVGTLTKEEPVPYFEVAKRLAEKIQSGEFERGIVLCGTGMGVSQVCNKFKGVFCALVESEFTAEKCRIINNSNVMALGGLVVTPPVAKRMVSLFLDTEWCQGEPPERVELLQGLQKPCNDVGQ